jgi:Spy/CpxP family protein refolding chaperone
MKRMLQAVLLGLALGTLGVSASAQPIHGDSPLDALGGAKAELNLNTSQQQQWDNAVAMSTAARNAMRANLQQARTALEAELAKAEPDLASLAAATDSVRDQMASLHRQARDAWLALYATFTPEQKGIARDAIKAKLAAIQARRATRLQGQPTSN